MADTLQARIARALGDVHNPRLDADVYSADMVRDIATTTDGRVRLTLLLDPKTGDNLAIALFETEEDMKKGDETLNGMNPTDDSMRRTSVEFYEVPVQTVS